MAKLVMGLLPPAVSSAAVHVNVALVPSGGKTDPERAVEEEGLHADEGCEMGTRGEIDWR